jgi:hypothetical protein
MDDPNSQLIYLMPVLSERSDIVVITDEAHRSQYDQLAANMGHALAYLANHWEGLCVYLDDGRVEMDSNPVENLIRPLTLNRKNSLFAGHDEGAQNWARLASLIGTCKLNGIEPFAYMKATLEALASGHRNADIDLLLPWNFRGAAHRGRDITNIYPTLLPPKLPQSLATNIAIFIANYLATTIVGKII